MMLLLLLVMNVFEEFICGRQTTMKVNDCSAVALHNSVGSFVSQSSGKHKYRVLLLQKVTIIGRN